MQNIKVTDNRIRKTYKTPEEFKQLKKSIKQVGLSNPILVSTNLELLGGFWRLKAFIEIHDEEPDNEGFIDIPTIIVTEKEEVEDLKMDFIDGRTNDYIRDTAVDRMNMIYNPLEFEDKKLHEYLGITEVEFEHRLEIGRALRMDLIPQETIEKYRKGVFDHVFLYNWWQDEKTRGKEVEIKPPLVDEIYDDSIFAEEIISGLKTMGYKEAMGYKDEEISPTNYMDKYLEAIEILTQEEKPKKKFDINEWK